jgi:hypothetical protein
MIEHALDARFALIGDVQGYSDRLTEALLALGVDLDEGVIPEGLTIIQVGDLVHKGPDSAGCIALVDRFLASSSSQWIQLIGNHEAQYIGGTPVARNLPLALQQVLRRWMDERRVRIAVAINSLELGPVLVTHSGITMSKWFAIGRPETSIEAADALNDELDASPSTAFAAGKELDFGVEPGVVWADACVDLLAGWTNSGTLPFSQVHGHSSPYQWSVRAWWGNVPRQLLASAYADQVARHTRFMWPDGRGIIGIDPGYGIESAAAPLVPLVLTAA